MTDLADFLLARIADDEAAARAAERWASPERWIGEADILISDAGGQGLSAYIGDLGMSDGGRERAAHIARWDPARVLAECEAKRRIVENARHWLDMTTDPDYDDVAITYTEVLRAIALPYATHPDWREEWKPYPDWREELRP